jgi:hypothetical protein
MIYFLAFILIPIALYGWLKRKALQRYVSLLRDEIADLKERLAGVTAERNVLNSQYEDMRGIASDAIQLAAKRHDTVVDLPRRDPDETYDLEIRKGDKVKVSYSVGPNNYISPIVAFCSNCNVSVRHELSDYPVPCPACKTLIDPVLDNPPELI